MTSFNPYSLQKMNNVERVILETNEYKLVSREFKKDSTVIRVNNHFTIGNKKLTYDLINHGVVPNKSKTIEFPHLNSKELELSFLLGYYDGDGKKGTTRIASTYRAPPPKASLTLGMDDWPIPRTRLPPQSSMEHLDP